MYAVCASAVISPVSILVRFLRLIKTHLGLVSHICVMKNSSHFPSDAYMRRKSLYFSYSPRGRPRKQCQAKMSFKLVWKCVTRWSILFICNTFSCWLVFIVIVFVHWVSTGVLYELRQCSLFRDYIPGYIPESDICSCINLRRGPSGPQAIRLKEKLLNCQTTRWVPLGSSRWAATKNSAVALSSRNNMISIQRSARTNEGKTTPI